MKNVIYTASLVLILSCNKKNENNEIIVSKIAPPLEDTLSKTIGNLDSISIGNSQKELAVNSDTISILANGVLKINEELNGVWSPVNIGINGEPDIIEKDYIYMFNAKDNTIEVYDTDDYFEGNSYEITTTDCSSNKIKTNRYYLRLGGGHWHGDNYCSKIIDLKKANNKTYLIVESPIANRSMTKFVKISDDPKFFPKEFK